MRKTKLLFLSSYLLSITAYADVPLTVEDLLTAQNRWRVELGLTYANVQLSGVSSDSPITLQVSPTQFITIPSRVVASQEQSDTLVLSPAIRYGLSGKTELYGRIHAVTNKTNRQDINGLEQEHHDYLESAWIGVNHRFVTEGEYPAVLLFFEAAITERVQLPQNTQAHQRGAGSFLAGVTTYRVNDPLVLALTSAYRLTTARVLEDQHYDVGDYWLINPSVSFAANNELSLSLGWQWRLQRSDRLNEQSLGFTRTSSDLALGLAWLWDEKTTLNITAKTHASGQNGAELGLVYTRKLGDLPKHIHGKSPS